jgi:hypothetical protein
MSAYTGSSDPEVAPMTRRELRLAEAARARATGEDLPDVQAVVAEVRQAREHREQDLDDLDFAPTAAIDLSTLPILSMADFYAANPPQPMASFPAPVRTDHLIAAEHQGDQTYDEIYPGLDEPGLEPTLPHHDQDSHTTMAHDFEAERAREAAQDHEPPREPDTRPSMLPTSTGPDGEEIISGPNLGIPQEVLDEITLHAHHGDSIAVVPEPLNGPEDVPGHDPAFTTKGRTEARNQRDRDQLAGESPEVATDYSEPHHQGIVAKALARRSGKKEHERILRLDPSHKDYDTGAHALAAERARLDGDPDEPTMGQVLAGRADPVEPTDPHWTPDQADEPVVKSFLAYDQERRQNAKVAEKPGSHSGRPSKFRRQARNHGVEVVGSQKTITTGRLSQILLVAGAILMTGLAIYGLTGLFYDINVEGDPGRDLVYVIAPGIIALVFIYSSFVVAQAEEESH